MSDRPRDLSRLLRPKSVALFGGGWAVNVATQLKRSGFVGDIWPIHPARTDLAGIPCIRSLDDLPAPPDASFVGVNREASIEVVGSLAAIGAGGATCFASGFLESEVEGAGGAEMQSRLVTAAGEMPILGPNCYGLINYLDNVALWPDQHGGLSVDSGVAIVAQSSNIAINMTMQRRALPIAYMVAAGNQAQTDIGAIASALLDDPRVTAIGLYLEGFGDIRSLEDFANRARRCGKPVVALKVGRSRQAQFATMTHTASLAGSASTASALLRRLCIIEVQSVGVFLETLKLVSMFGPLPGNAVCSVSCSGGEASLVADMSAGTNIHFREFGPAQKQVLKNDLGPIVTISNPLDYHTFIWGDTERMTRVFAGVMRENFDLVVFLLDLPRADRCDPAGYQCAVDAIIAARLQTGARVAVLGSLPENLSETDSARYVDAGVLPMHGMEEALLAIDAAIEPRMPVADFATPVALSRAFGRETELLDEAEAKARLAEFGLVVPRTARAANAGELIACADKLRFPVALKGLGIAHKSEAGAVILDIADGQALIDAAERMGAVTDGYLVEEMATEALAELLVGITRDPTGLFLLTVGAGGVLAELLDDTCSMLLPASRDEIDHVLRSLKISRILEGYRGSPAASLAAATNAILSICGYAEANRDRLVELDVNPLIVRRGDAVAVDALISLYREEPQ